VVNLYHEVIELDSSAETILPFADGSRTVPELAAASGLSEAAVHKTLGELTRLALFQA